MENYAVLSLETHLFFARIMKEHALFLQAGFPCKDHAWIQKADWFRQQFENLLRETVRVSNGVINSAILNSDELVTRFTIPAEKRTEHLSGIPIDRQISVMEHRLQSGCQENPSKELVRAIHRINDRSLHLLNGIISFKENILREVSRCNLFTTNYPLLIEHILREARLYRATIEEFMFNRQRSYKSLKQTEDFWNQIMMEHALFIRGLLDPSEVELIESANTFSIEYQKLLEAAQSQDCHVTEDLTKKSLAETIRYSEFKAAGTQGILECKIASIILPLLADHVLREANHYIRLLQYDCPSESHL